jgi:YVTN family beta-propeller protein
MRSFLGGLFLVTLMAPHLAAAATASINGTTIPTAPQIVDSQSNVWTLVFPSEAYRNGQLTSTEAIILVYYGGAVYQEHFDNSWSVWRNGALAASSDPRIVTLSGTSVPTATQIVDSQSNVWILSSAQAYINGLLTPSGGVILLLNYGGVVYQENIHHSWWVWGNGAWAASSDPRIVSPSGTSIPAATQIVDGQLNVWTVSGGQVYEKGQLTPSGGVILLVYANNAVYQENIHHNWWRWNSRGWVATSAPLYASASGTTIPSATQILDSQLKVWTLSGGKAYENGSLTPSGGVILLLFYEGSVYQENLHHNWWRWNGGAWVATSSDPRAGQPLAYVGSANNTVSVIDTGANRVIGTVPVSFQPQYIAVAPDAKHVYVTGYNTNKPAGGSVAVIATASQKVTATITVPYSPVGIVVSPDGTKVYVASAFTDITDTIVSVIDTATNVVAASIDIPELMPQGIAISSDGKKLYVPIQEGHTVSGSVAVVDTTTYKVSDFFDPTSILDYYWSAAISPDNSKLYANAYIYPPGGTNVIAIFNPATGGLTKTIPEVMTVAIFSPDSKHLYGVGLGGVAVIDNATDVATTAVANLPGATSLAITPDGRHLYITDSSTNSVAVADTSTYTISTVIGGVNAAGPIGIVPP